MSVHAYNLYYSLAVCFSICALCTATLLDFELTSLSLEPSVALSSLNLKVVYLWVFCQISNSQRLFMVGCRCVNILINISLHCYTHCSVLVYIQPPEKNDKIKVIHTIK